MFQGQEPSKARKRRRLILEPIPEDEYIPGEPMDVNEGYDQTTAAEGLMWEAEDQLELLRGRSREIDPPFPGLEDVRFQGKERVVQRYMSFGKTPIIPDRGFAEGQLRHRLISRFVENQPWQGFLTHSQVRGSIERTREFFANISIDGFTWVRGTEVEFRASYLNRFLNCDAPEDNLFIFDDMNKRRWPMNKEMVQKIMRTFCGTEEDASIRSGSSTFKTKAVKRHLMPFLELFFSKIKPIHHTQTTSGGQIWGLNDILLRGKKVNVGSSF